MRKLVILFVLLVCVGFVYAGNDLSDYPEFLGSKVVVVLGDEASSSDVLAATTIAQGIKNDVDVKTESCLVSEVESFSGYLKILIGNPCDNKLIVDALYWDDCSQWPYRDGEGLIRIYDEGIVVAGSTADDLRMTANALAEHKDLSGIEIVVQGSKESFVSTRKIRERKEVKVECYTAMDCEVPDCEGDITVDCIGGKCVYAGSCYDFPDCDGCFLDEQCVGYGFRSESMYCSLEREFLVQESSGNYCENSFECLSNLCIDNECVEAGIFNKIINWFKRVFGF